jgi:predicted anti-sigma-YlaC factor YlaD
MTTCAEVSTLLERFLSLELSPATESDVRLHLAGCASCRAAVEAAEPATGIALRLAAVAETPDEEFVAGVLAGVRQHRIERRLARDWRRWVGAAAALLVVVIGGYVGTRGKVAPGASTVAMAAAHVPTDDAAFVEVEGDGVTVYQLTSPSEDGVQVALIIDPRLEL